MYFFVPCLLRDSENEEYIALLNVFSMVDIGIFLCPKNVSSVQIS